MRQAELRYARRMTKLILGLVAIGTIGCGDSGSDAPSCMQATSHYYASGCTLFDGSTNPPSTYTQTQAQVLCQNVNSQVPDRCRAEFDNWKSCLGDTIAHATTNADCDCSTEQDALFGCQ
jgi:hypothetical protein